MEGVVKVILGSYRTNEVLAYALTTWLRNSTRLRQHYNPSLNLNRLRRMYHGFFGLSAMR